MSVLITGATGHIGSAVLRSLLAHGRDVVALVRNDTNAERVAALGASPVVGDLADLDLVARLVAQSDGFIHTASPGDESSAKVDGDMVDVVIQTLSGTSTPYLHTGGVWVFGDGQDIVETDPFKPLPITAWRLDIESRLRASAVRSTIIAPTVVYGHGQGIPNVLSGDDGVHLVGNGIQHWATVHADDLADLYFLALDRAGADAYFLGASGVNPTVLQLGEAAANGRPVIAESIEQSQTRLGALFADALLLDQQAAGRHARDTLGWNPTRPTLAEQLASGYATADTRE